MHPHETRVSFTEHERAAKRVGLAALLAGVAALVFALAVLLYVFWLLLAPLTATAFDADGVRCYHRAVQIACLKTANPG
jgi:flagellar basal body-associated protein FliL